MKKTTFIRTIKIIALIIPIVLFVSIAQYYFFCHFDHGPERIRRFYQEEKNSLDVVVLGASDVFAGYAPGLAYDELGFTSYIYAGNSNPGSLYKYELKEILSTQSPQAIVVEIHGFLHGEHSYQFEEARFRAFVENIPFSLNKLDAIAHYDVDNKISYLIPFIKYHGNWTTLADQLDIAQWKLSTIRKPSYLKGTVTIATVDPYDPDSIPEPPESAPGEIVIAQEFLIDFLEYCKAEDLPVSFVRFPHRNNSKYAVGVSQVEDVLEQYGYSLLNLENNIGDYNLDYNQDFYDNEHLNIYGQEKLTRYLGKHIADTLLGDPIVQSEENAKHWAECAAAYDIFNAYAKDMIVTAPGTMPAELPWEVGSMKYWMNHR